LCASRACGVGNILTISFNGREFGGKVSGEEGAPFQSRADGVGHIFTAWFNTTWTF
jgi:hypothetical protein